MITWTKRALRAIRRDGIRPVILRVLGRSFLRYVVLFEVRAADVAPSRATVPVEVRPLRPDDLGAHLRFRPEIAEDELRRRLALGHLCFVTWTEEEISSEVWFRHDEMWIPELDRSIGLEGGTSYCYDSWTRPDMRGRSIVAARAVGSCRAMADAGHERTVGYVAPDNRVAARAVAKLGARPYGRVGVLRIGVARVEFLRRYGRPTEWSIRRSRGPLRREPAAAQR